MRPIDIALADLETVRSILREHAPGLEVRAFGSRVSWTARETSDLDVALLTEEPLSIARMTNLKAAFTKSYLPFRVDIVDWASTSENFRKVIEREHVVLVERHRTTKLDGWRKLQFGDAFQVNPRVHLKRGNVYPFVSMAVVDTNSRDTYVVERRKFSSGGSRFANGDTLMARITPCLENGKITRFCSSDLSNFGHGSTEFIVIRGTPNLTDNEFAYYLTRSEQVRNYAIKQMTGTSGRQRVPTDSLIRLIVSIPPLPEQRSIAQILGTLDDKIELNRRMNKTLEEMTQALFKSWFVDFSPVRSKMEGSDTGLPQHFSDLFPDRLVDSEIGEIPDGWDVGCLADIASSPRRSFDPADICGGTPYIGLRHMPRHSIALIEWEGSEKVTSNKFAFKKGEFLFGKLRPYFHKVGLAPVSGICSTDIVVISPNSITWSTFVLATISSIDFISYTNQTSTGTKMPRTSWKTMNRYALCLPPEPVVQLLQNVTEPMLYRIVTNIHHNRNLAALRDILLPKLVSGMLRVEDAAKIVATI